MGESPPTARSDVGTVGAPPTAAAWTHDGRETTTLVVTDRDGKAAALIQSVFVDFGSGGSGVIGRESGVLLNTGWRVFPGSVPSECFAAGATDMHTLHNFIAVDAVDDAGRVRFAGGSPGGDT